MPKDNRNKSLNKEHSNELNINDRSKENNLYSTLVDAYGSRMTIEVSDKDIKDQIQLTQVKDGCSKATFFISEKQLDR